MKRYFLGLALALLVIPGVSRGDITGVLSNSNTGLNSTTNQASEFRFTLGNGQPGFRLNSIQLYQGSSLLGGTVDLTFRLLNSAGTFQLGSTDQSFTGVNTATLSSAFALNNFGISSLDANTEYRIRITASSNSTSLQSSNTEFLNSDNVNVFQNVYNTNTNGGQYTTTDYYRVSLNATSVPEPGTIILTGSVLAIGSGISALRRFRKKNKNENV